MSSEVDQRRQIIKLIRSNSRVEGDNVLWDIQKPFDLIINCSDRNRWRTLVVAFSNGKVTYNFRLSHIQTVFESFGIEVKFT